MYEQQVDMSSVEAVKQAKRERDTAVKEAKRANEHADYQIRFTKKDAQNEIKKIKKESTRQTATAKTREGIWQMGMTLSLVLSIYYNQGLQNDVWSLVTSPKYLFIVLLFAGILYVINHNWLKEKRTKDTTCLFIAVMASVIILELPLQITGVNRISLMVIGITILTLKNIISKPI